MRPLLLLVLCAAGVLPAQQLIQAANDNPSYGNYAVGWPSSVIAFRFTAAATTTLAAAQVFTGNQTPANHTLEIRTRSTVTGLPDALVGQAGAWTTVHARCWQGAVFAQPAAVQAGQDYFLVWRVQGMFPQHSVSADAEPANVPVEVRYSDGNSWHAMGMVPGKFRLFTPSTSGTLQSYGAGKPGQYGVPTIGVTGWPAVASPIDVWLDDAARNVLAVLVLGLPIPGGVPLGWVDVYVTPEILLPFVTKSHTSPFVGGATHSLFVPDDPIWLGFPLSFQWGVFDPLAADGFSHTAAVTAWYP
ncbi:MAG: hypothetical protein KF830_08380 [Planctomycetes bacterium]|nr:hypothetical protein [Planctomycetota bacterium]